MDPDKEPAAAQKWAMVFTAIFALIIMFIGFFGNLLTVLALPHCRRHRKTTTWFVVNLAAAEALFCVTILPVTAAHLISLYATSHALLSDGACAYFAFCRYVTMLVGLLSIAAIAINRCVLITMPKNYPKIFTSTNTSATIACIWLVSVVLLLFPLLEAYGKFGYNDSTDECDFVDNTARGQTPRNVMMFAGYFFPCGVIVVSYALIFYKARRSSLKMKALSQSNPQSTANQTAHRPAVGLRSRDIRIARTIAVIFVAFIVCCTPVSVLHYLDHRMHMPTALLLLHPLYWLQYCLNMFIYVLMNNQYREAYVHFIAKWWPGIRNISGRLFREPSSDSTRSHRATTPTSLLRFSTRRGGSKPSTPTQRLPPPDILEVNTPTPSLDPSV
ncbi:G-protein coupled receptor moody-like [Penaeus japonicus]|uniref:G-protein coupled receptor moody-like n=1 Tax=Penaeus japonicus TaxID=27405 RepID=UPI001C70B00A|nr:G-protein coupled receptor moody-like [Penaeus japonicus]